MRVMFGARLLGFPAGYSSDIVDSGNWTAGENHQESRGFANTAWLKVSVPVGEVHRLVSTWSPRKRFGKRDSRKLYTAFHDGTSQAQVAAQLYKRPLT